MRILRFSGRNNKGIFCHLFSRSKGGRRLHIKGVGWSGSVISGTALRREKI
jgi:hypothetical protein